MLLRQQEIAVLTSKVGEHRDKLRRNEDELAKIKLCEIQNELKLLEQEYEEYVQTTKEVHVHVSSYFKIVP